MNKIKWVAAEHPLAFGLAITSTFILMLFISALLSTMWSGEGYGNVGGTTGRILSIALLLALLHRLGWLRLAGFTGLGRWQTWLLTLLPLAYAVAVSVYAFTDNFDLRFSGSGLTALIILFIMAAAFLEEIAFRGLILYGFARVWGSTNRGLIQSVLISSILFGAVHILDTLSGRPLLNVLLQGLEASFLGIFLGTLVLSGKSIYPAVFFHCFFNLAGYLSFGRQGLEPASSSWLLFSVLMFPLALYGIYLIRGVLYRSAVPAAV